MLRLILVAAFVCLVFAGPFTHSKPAPVIANFDSMPALRAEIVNEVNSRNAGWTASLNQGKSSISGKTIAEVKRMMGAKKGGPVLPLRTEFPISVEALPTTFDARQQWPNCTSIGTIRDQSACGSCWAFGAVEAQSDRTCIETGQQVELSAQDMNSCCTSCGDGCDGGFPSAAWDYWVRSGVVSNSCDPYSLPSCDHHLANSTNPCPSNEYPTPACKKTCVDGETWTTAKHFGAKAYGLSGAAAMAQELVSNGPLETAFDVYEDFLSYSGGVYRHTTGQFLGGHAVKILGFGTLNGTPYWLVANSWNPDWGLKGFFMIERGNNECGFESSASAGTAKTSA
jgi:cathepsin B